MGWTWSTVVRSLPGSFLPGLQTKQNNGVSELRQKLCTSSSQIQRQTVVGSAIASAHSVLFSQLSSWQLFPQESYLHLLFKVIICLWSFTGLQHYSNIHVWFDSTTELSVYSLPNILTAGPTSSCVTQLSLKKPFQNTCSGQDWVIQEGEKWRIGCRWGENYWLINFPF